MNKDYFIALLFQLRVINTDLNETIGKEVKTYYYEMREKRKLIYTFIHEEMIHKWIFENTHLDRYHTDEYKHTFFIKLKNRDENDDDFVDRYIHPGRSILIKGQQRLRGCPPTLSINRILKNQLNIYIGGHKLHHLVRFSKNTESLNGLQLWKGVLAHKNNYLIHDILTNIGFTDHEVWICSFGKNKNKLIQLRRIYEYLIKKEY